MGKNIKNSLSENTSRNSYILNALSRVGSYVNLSEVSLLVKNYYKRIMMNISTILTRIISIALKVDTYKKLNEIIENGALNDFKRVLHDKCISPESAINLSLSTLIAPLHSLSTQVHDRFELKEEESDGKKSIKLYNMVDVDLNFLNKAWDSEKLDSNLLVSGSGVLELSRLSYINGDDLRKCIKNARIYFLSRDQERFFGNVLDLLDEADEVCERIIKYKKIKEDDNNLKILASDILKMPVGCAVLYAIASSSCEIEEYLLKRNKKNQFESYNSSNIEHSRNLRIATSSERGSEIEIRGSSGIYSTETMSDVSLASRDSFINIRIKDLASAAKDKDFLHRAKDGSISNHELVSMWSLIQNHAKESITENTKVYEVSDKGFVSENIRIKDHLERRSSFFSSFGKKIVKTWDLFSKWIKVNLEHVEINYKNGAIFFVSSSDVSKISGMYIDDSSQLRLPSMSYMRHVSRSLQKTIRASNDDTNLSEDLFYWFNSNNLSIEEFCKTEMTNYEVCAGIYGGAPPIIVNNNIIKPSLDRIMEGSAEMASSLYPRGDVQITDNYDVAKKAYAQMIGINLSKERIGDREFVMDLVRSSSDIHYMKKQYIDREKFLNIFFTDLSNFSRKSSKRKKASENIINSWNLKKDLRKELDGLLSLDRSIDENIIINISEKIKRELPQLAIEHIVSHIIKFRGITHIEKVVKEVENTRLNNGEEVSIERLYDIDEGLFSIISTSSIQEIMMMSQRRSTGKYMNKKNSYLYIYPSNNN